MKPLSRSKRKSPVRVTRPAPAQRTAPAICILLLLAILPSLNSLRNGFVWDDQQQIVMNPDLRPGADWSRLFSAGVWAHLHPGSPSSNIYYRPLQMVTYRSVVAMVGANSFAFHLVSLIFAVGSVLLAFEFFWKVSGSRNLAFAAAALFAVQPVHTEAVDWISALPDIGCTIFVLAGFMAFVSGYDTSVESKDGKTPTPRLLRWGISLGCFALALLWKETAAVFPLLIAAYVLVLPPVNSNRVKAAVMYSLPFWGVLAGYLLLRLQLLGMIASTRRNWQLSSVHLALTLPYLMAQYWWKLAVPFGLNAYHVFSPVSSARDLRAATGVVFLLAIVAFLLYTARRLPLAAFGGAWVLITLLPVMNIYAVGRNVFAERYLYLPSVGFCLLVAILAAELLRRVPEKQQMMASAVGLITVVSVFAAITMARNPDWQDNATLFARTLKSSPNSPFAHIMVAAATDDQVRGSPYAEEHYVKAAEYAEGEVPPDRLNLAIANQGLAWIYSERGEYDRALAMLAKAREAAPEDPTMDSEQGLILTKAGRWDEAATYLRKASQASGADANVWNALGIYEQRRNQNLELAAKHFQRALDIHTVEDALAASIHSNLGSVYGEQRRYAEAINEFKSALAIAPGDPEYCVNLATALAASGQYDAARAELRDVLAKDPGYPPALEILGQLGGH